MTDSSRDVPVVIVARKLDGEDSETLAARIAELTAGIGAVYLVDPNVIGEFNAATGLPDDYGVLPGTVRAIMPLGADASPDRDLVLSARQVAANSPDDIGHDVARHIASQFASRRPPQLYQQLRPALYAALMDQGQTVELANYYVQEAEAARAQVSELEREIARLKFDLSQSRKGSAADADVTPEVVVADVANVAEAIAFARQHLTHVVIPETAPCDIDKLDQTEKAAVWGTSLRDGLLALNDYAAHASTFKGGFKQWCDSAPSGCAGWPSTNYASMESETTQNNAKFRNARMFAVDQGVDSSGRIFMQSHLKLERGGNQNIPRIYFFDDSGGATAKIHIGFIGPHHLVPNPSGA